MADNMPVVATICHRNLFGGGERNLIVERAKALWKYSGIASHIVSFGGSSEASRLCQEFPGVTIEANRFEGMRSIRRLQYHLFNRFKEIENQHNVCGAILSGILALPLAKAIKKILSNRPLLIDIHGALEELIEYPKLIKLGTNKTTSARWPWRLLYHWSNLQLKNALHLAEAALVVSHPMIDYLCEKYGSIQTIFIPCGISGQIPTADDLIRMRKQSRIALGVPDSDPVFCYLGGLSEWQCVSEGFSMAAAIIRYLRRGAVAVATNMPDEARILAQKAGIGNKLVYVGLVHESEIINWLAGGDAGLLLRHTNITNKIAFPNKFAQYLAAGLMIFTSPGLLEPAAIVRMAHVGILIDLKSLDMKNIEFELQCRNANLLRYYEHSLKTCLEIADLDKYISKLAEIFLAI